jgi:hypothetical protein
VIVAPDHMRHAHVMVIDDDGEHISRCPVRAQDDHVVQLVVAETDRALHRILDQRFAVPWRLHSDDEGAVWPGRWIGVAPGRMEQGRATLGPRGFTECLDLVLGGKTAIGRTPGKHLSGHLGMAMALVELAHRLAVPIEAKPSEAPQDRGRCLWSGAFAVGVLDAQQERAVAPPGVKPVEQRGAAAADMQIARRRRGKSGHDGAGARLGQVL